jgi:hypothetical protein
VVKNLFVQNAGYFNSGVVGPDLPPCVVTGCFFPHSNEEADDQDIEDSFNKMRKAVQIV